MEYPLILAAAAAGLAFTGPGAFSVDEALGFSWSAAASVVALAVGIAGGTLQLLAKRRAPVGAAQRQPA